jgi:hypothetical protein
VHEAEMACYITHCSSPTVTLWFFGDLFSTIKRVSNINVKSGNEFELTQTELTHMVSLLNFDLLNNGIVETKKFSKIEEHE